MSKFLDELQNEIHDMNVGYITNNAEIFGISHENINNMVDSLGENARRLLEIGIVQDRLVELGLDIRTFGALAIDERILVVFTNQAAILLNRVFEYTSPTWQEDLINKVKELINYE